MWESSKLWQDDHDEDEQLKNNSNWNYDEKHQNSSHELFCLKVNGPSCNRVFVEMYSSTKCIIG